MFTTFTVTLNQKFNNYHFLQVKGITAITGMSGPWTIVIIMIYCIFEYSEFANLYPGGLKDEMLRSIDQGKHWFCFQTVQILQTFPKFFCVIG